MEIRNIYEDPYGEENLYSVLMDEYELALFSDAKEEKDNKSGKGLKGALVGAGIGAGISGAALGSFLGLGKIADKKKLQLDNEVHNLGAQWDYYASRKDYKKVQELSNKMHNTYIPKIDKFLDGPWEKIRSLRDRLKQNPGKASAIAAGIAALGAGAGYGVSKLKNRKRDEE